MSSSARHQVERLGDGSHSPPDPAYAQGWLFLRSLDVRGNNRVGPDTNYIVDDGSRTSAGSRDRLAHANNVAEVSICSRWLC